MIFSGHLTQKTSPNSVLCLLLANTYFEKEIENAEQWKIAPYSQLIYGIRIKYSTRKEKLCVAWMDVSSKFKIKVFGLQWKVVNDKIQ